MTEENVPEVGELVDLLDQLETTIRDAKAIPLSGSVRVEREEVLDLVGQLRAVLPEELRAARWMVREREAFIARTNERAKDIVEKANTRAAELVSESRVLAEAVEEANILVRRAEGEARRIRLEAEDLADDRLEHLEVLFRNLLNQVRGVRSQYHEARPAPPPVPE
jgi:vacuolar-type H+-ATPase subunit H